MGRKLAACSAEPLPGAPFAYPWRAERATNYPSARKHLPWRPDSCPTISVPRFLYRFGGLSHSAARLPQPIFAVLA